MVPESIRKVFGAFPLYQYPNTATVAKDRKADAQFVLYVHNIEGGLSTDPQCLNIQGLFRLKKPQASVKVVPGSVHVSRNSKLPYLLEYSNSKPRVYTQEAAMIRNLFPYSSTEVEFFCTLVATSLGDAWRLSLLEQINSKLLQQLYLPSNRTEMPWVVQQSMTCQATEAMLRVFESRYPLLVKYHETTYFDMPKVFVRPAVRDQVTRDAQKDILAQAHECLEALTSALEQGTVFGGEQLNELDVILFAHIHLITQYIPNSELGQLVMEYKELVTHSDNVYRQLF